MTTTRVRSRFLVQRDAVKVDEREFYILTSLVIGSSDFGDQSTYSLVWSAEVFV